MSHLTATRERSRMCVCESEGVSDQREKHDSTTLGVHWFSRDRLVKRGEIGGLLRAALTHRKEGVARIVSTGIS